MVERSYTRPDVLAVQSTTYTKISGSGSPPSNTSVDDLYLRQLGVYKAAETTDFQLSQAKGLLLPLNSYTRYDYREVRNVGLYQGTNKGPNPKYSVLVSGPADAISGNRMSTLTGANELLSEMSADLPPVSVLQQEAFADIAPDLDALTSLAEAPKTLRMIFGVRKRALALIRRAVRKGFSTAREAAALWLEWRYGWRILGFEIEAFVKYWNRRFKWTYLFGKTERSYSTMETASKSGGGYYCRYDDITNIFRRLDVVCRAVARYTGRNANVLASPVNTGWELIPFSFVADWFISVGDAIKAWTVVSSSDGTVSSIGYKLEEECSASRENPTIGTGVNAIAPFSASGSGLSNGSLRIRVPFGGHFFLPQLRVNLTNPRIADAAALLLGFTKHAGLKARSP